MRVELLRSSTWRRGRQRARGPRTATATTPARCSTARSPTGSCRWRSTAAGGVRHQRRHARRAAGTGRRSADANAPVQLPEPQEAGGGSPAGRRLGDTRRRRRRAGAARHRDRLGPVRQHALAAELHLRPRRQVRRHPREGADAAAPAAVAGRAERTVRADAAAVRRHHGLPAGGLPRLRRRSTGRIPPTTGAKLSYTYRGGWDDSISTSAKDDDDVLVDLAQVRRRRPSSGSCAARRRPLGIKQTDVNEHATSSSTRRATRPTPERADAARQRVQRLRQRLASS